MVSNVLGEGGITSNAEIAQTFVADCLGDGLFNSITILNTSNATDVTLTILDGGYMDGSVQYTQTGIGLNVLSPTENVVLLQGGTGSLAYKAGNTYTFVFTAAGTPVAAPLMFSQSMGNTYTDGMLYQGGTPGGDLFFMVTGTAGALPVELSTFQAEHREGRTRLYWQTASEINNRGFEIQRSRDARNWEVIAFIEGQGSAASYTFKDEEGLLAGNYYYRLRQVDWDGQFEYSEVRAVQVEGMADTKLLVYPNPVKRGQRLSIRSAFYKSGVCLRLISALGEVVEEAISSHFDIPIAIPPGIYYLQQCDEAGHSKRLVVL